MTTTQLLSRISIVAKTHGNPRYRTKNADNAFGFYIVEGSKGILRPKIIPVETIGKAKTSAPLPLLLLEDEIAQPGQLQIEGTSPFSVGAIIADGMGDGKDADEASLHLLKVFQEFLYISLRKNISVNEFMEEFYLYALDSFVFKFKGELRAATTGLGVVIDTNRNLYLGNMGDSRVYLVRPQNESSEVCLLSRDHSESRLRRESMIDINNPAAFDRYDNGNSGPIYQFFSNSVPHRLFDKTTIETTVYELESNQIQEGDTLVLVTDGAFKPFRGVIQNPGKQEDTQRRYKLAEIIRDAPSLSCAADEILHYALGIGSLDNATVVLLHFGAWNTKKD